MNPDAQTVASAQGDGLLVRSWDGEVYAQLEGRIAEFSAGQSGFLANATAPVLRLESLPAGLQELASPRPDTITGSIPQSGDRLYTHTREGAISVQGASGPPVVLEAGQAGVVGAGGAAGFGHSTFTMSSGFQVWS